MASDLTIEIFAYDIISNVFMTLGEIRPSIFQIYGAECCKIRSYEEVYGRMFYEAVLARSIFLKTIYLKVLTAEKIKSLKSLSDCYDYAIQICDRKDLFGHLTVFERMFATLAFVVFLCVSIYYDNTCAIDLLNYGHMLWAMYFDKLADKFYKEGGWEELKRVANSYFGLVSFIDHLAESIDLNAIKETFDNYHQFKKTIQFYKCKHVSKQWAKFRINSFEAYIIVPLDYQYSIDAYEADLLMEDFKRLCNPHLPNCIGIFEKGMTFDSFEEIRDDNGSLEKAHFVSEQKGRINDELLKHSARIENLSQSESSFSNLKAVPFSLIDNNINLTPHENTFKEKDLRKPNGVSFSGHLLNNRIAIPVKAINGQFEIEIGSSPKIINLHLENSSENVSPSIKNEIFPTKIFSARSTGWQNDIAGEVVPSGTIKNPNSKAVLPLTRFSPVNKFANITVEKMVISKDVDDTDSTTKTSSVDQMDGCERSENTPPKPILSPKCFKLVNKFAKTTYERPKTPNDTEDLEMGDFQRMILVLGDRQGIEYVRSTLHSSESILGNLQENDTKRRKRCRKKKKTPGI